jgi:DNA-directed RNA polymerase II subunit RPB2
MEAHQSLLEMEDEINSMNHALETAQKSYYTHCEIDPQATLSISATLIPMPEHNAGPRNVFQCSMGKQAVGISHSNQAARWDVGTKLLAYPQQPLFQPQINNMIGETNPTGENVIIAFMQWRGWNQEDAFVFNKGALDRGLFRYVKHTIKRTSLRSSPEEHFGRPNPKEGEPADRYENIDENGLPIVGSVMRRGQCAIGKFHITPTGIKENTSIYVGNGEEGIVDRVLYTINDDQRPTVKVRIRQVNTPVTGDKFTPRHSQKGTIGTIVPEDEMPYVTKNGMIPSVIVNPLSFLSRMTIAKMIEIMASKVASISGERVNASAYRPYDYEELKRNLLQYGYTDDGKEEMIDGLTGRKFQSRIMIGPCHYQMLRHHVNDKIQVRSRGSINAVTHQPVGGRKAGQGLRFGEMERDSLISHGATAFLRDRLCDVSDAYETVVCASCGNLAIINADTKQVSCRNKECSGKNIFGKVTIPYVFKLLIHLLWGMGVNIKLDVQ